MPAARLALATCAALPDLDADERLLLGALRGRGVDAEPAIWDADVDWSAFEAVVIRSTWDYSARRSDFVTWARSLPRVINSAAVIEWNTDKRYLRELAAAGIPVVPTTWIEPGDAFADPGQSEFVVKPSVSAGARDTVRHRAGHVAARDHVSQILAGGRTAMVQPYITSVDERGETALIYFGGRFSHAIRKRPILAPDGTATDSLYAREHVTPRLPSSDEREVADRVLDALPWPRGELAYARVDLVRGDDGGSVLLELELTEPSLFLAHSPGAAGRLASALVSGLGL